ncbi:PREDICTED: uncharacterized protein LOC109184467 [Ipomoea nil]|uniref:uncharacterized protein LOC109184467 n=1 Tax=Ipomoea nil TaxID=35883 RepID=UPI0009009E17|nr:PREDICTED: uncharacterized protein LOC109184467 [Ipomoea nil]
MVRFTRMLVPTELAKLHRGSLELARKRVESGGSSIFKKSRPSFPARVASSSSQGPIRMEPQIKDLCPLKFFLGLEIDIRKKGIFVNQRKYALELLDSTGFTHSKPVKSPVIPSTKLSKESGISLADITQYRRLVGKLLYLTITIPNISFTTQKLSQFLDYPTDIHLQAAHRVLRYIKGVPTQGMFFPATNQLHLKGFFDSDWAACPDTKRSVFGFCMFLGSAQISWKSKKQLTVSRSSSKAEYRAIVAASCEIQWTNHIELDYHIIRETLRNGVLKLIHVPTASHLADVFTNPHAPTTFNGFMSKLGLYNIYDPACRGSRRWQLGLPNQRHKNKVDFLNMGSKHKEMKNNKD